MRKLPHFAFAALAIASLSACADTGHVTRAALIQAPTAFSASPDSDELKPRSTRASGKVSAGGPCWAENSCRRAPGPGPAGTEHLPFG